MFLSSTAAAAQQQQHSSSGGGTSSCCFGPSTPGQTRTPNEENGTPKRDVFRDSAYYKYALRIVLRDASRIVEHQKQQHSSNSTAAVVAATSRLRTKRCCFTVPLNTLRLHTR